MAQDQSALLNLLEELRTADGGEMMRRLLGGALQILIDLEATQQIGADRFERSEGRTTQRNGTRPKTVATTSGDLTVSILQASLGVVLPVAAGPGGLRPATAADPLGVQLVITDSHRGLTNAVARVLPGAAWQRCRVHFMRNVLARVPKAQAEFVSASVRTVFAQATPGLVRAQVDVVADTLAERFPAVAEMLTDAKADITAFADFPEAHWRKIWSTNPIERLNREIKRRTDVVGIFPTTASVTRLVGAVLIEAHDEWQVSDRRYLSETSMQTLLTTTTAAVRELPVGTTDTPEKETTTEAEIAA